MRFFFSTPDEPCAEMYPRRGIRSSRYISRKVGARRGFDSIRRNKHDATHDRSAKGKGRAFYVCFVCFLRETPVVSSLCGCFFFNIFSLWLTAACAACAAAAAAGVQREGRDFLLDGLSLISTESSVLLGQRSMRGGAALVMSPVSVLSLPS